MAYPKLSTDILSAAIQGFEQQKLLIDGRIAELRAMMSGEADEPQAAPGPITKTRRKMSAAARKRMMHSGKGGVRLRTNLFRHHQPRRKAPNPNESSVPLVRQQ